MRRVEGPDLSKESLLTETTSPTLTVNAERTDVAMNQLGKSRGFGIVVVSTAAEAQRVIESLRGYEFQGRSLEVREDRNAPGGAGSGTGFTGNVRSGSINGEYRLLSSVEASGTMILRKWESL